MYELTINGEAHRLEVEGDKPLLWALRDVVGLTGTKYGCGVGQCGVCTVLLEGAAVRSCVLPVSAAAGKSITTIEGLSEDGSHPVQAAWVAENVPQCGFCQPGQILSAVALLATKPVPTDQDIDTAMAGVLCRCGTYLRIRKAIHRAAASASGRATP